MSGLILPPDRQGDPNPPPPVYVPHVDWWRDGRVILNIVTLVLGFGGTWLTLYYQGLATRNEVQTVQDRQTENTARLDRVEDNTAATKSIIVGP